MRWPAALVLAAALVAPASRAADDGRAWLQRMSHALTHSSYIGEFQIDGRGYSERMKIIHCVHDGTVNERLVSLTGPGRELIRRGDEVTAYLPDKRLAVIERRTSKGALLGTLPYFDAGLEQWYQVVLESPARELNGRPAAVVAVRPRDNYRFGHRLWIDEATAMPVRTELLDSSGAVVESLRFLRLEIRNDIPDSSLLPGVDPSHFRWVRQAAYPPQATVPWSVKAPPPGFRLSASSVRDIIGVPSPVNQLVLSDGLASVSVFIHAETAGQHPAQGAGHAGAASTFSTVMNGQQITAVGEVPPQTLEVIVHSIVPHE